jgi:hypothetical protein
LVAAATRGEKPHDPGADDDADAEVAAYLVAFGPPARGAAVGDVLAVVANQVVGQIREVCEQELGTGDDLVRRVGWREPPAEPAYPPVPDDFGGPAGVELLERDGFDGGVRLVEDPAAELDAVASAMRPRDRWTSLSPTGRRPDRIREVRSSAMHGSYSS